MGVHQKTIVPYAVDTMGSSTEIQHTMPQPLERGSKAKKPLHIRKLSGVRRAFREAWSRKC